MLAPLLGRATTMPVVQAKQGGAVEVNHVYIVPPGDYLEVRQGRLALSPIRQRPPRPKAVDQLMVSLAQDQRERAIGIVLTGTDGDGTLGVKAIKSEGGITIAQSPETAAHAGMPAQRRGQRAWWTPSSGRRHPRGAHRLHRARAATRPAAPDAEPVTTALQDVLAKVRSAQRARLPRLQDADAAASRAAAHGPAPRGHHGRLPRSLRETPSRSGGAGRRPADQRHRVLPRARGLGVAGRRHRAEDPRAQASKATPCASGCRPAPPAKRPTAWRMVLLRAAARRPSAPASADLRHRHRPPRPRPRAHRPLPGGIIEHGVARAPARASSAHRRRLPGAARSCASACIFAPQNLVSDPPFSHMDLVSCRNLLIYMEPELQRQVLRSFPLRARPRRLSLPRASPRRSARWRRTFAPVSQRARIYRRIGAAGGAGTALGRPRRTAQQSGGPAATAVAHDRPWTTASCCANPCSSIALGRRIAHQPRRPRAVLPRRHAAATCSTPRARPRATCSRMLHDDLRADAARRAAQGGQRAPACREHRHDGRGDDGSGHRACALAVGTGRRRRRPAPGHLRGARARRRSRRAARSGARHAASAARARGRAAQHQARAARPRSRSWRPPTRS